METATAPRLVEEARASWAVILGAVVIAIAVLVGALLLRPGSAVRFDSEYQAVLLTNGQVYYGRLEAYGTAHPVLREVYYVQSTTDPQTQQQTHILLKRGKEWHAPDWMLLNPNQILLVEPVGAASKVAELIRALKAQN